jgi:AMMECR1 domain-containing protein
LDATLSLAEAVRVTAIGVLDDPRFGHCPVCLDELELLELEISVVSPLQPVEHPLDFDLMEHGIYLTIGQRSGCFLPQVARETGWSREQLLARLCSEKMGLPANGWREPRARLSVFTTLTIGPEPFVLPGSMIDGD